MTSAFHRLDMEPVSPGDLCSVAMGGGGCCLASGRTYSLIGSMIKVPSAEAMSVYLYCELIKLGLSLSVCYLPSASVISSSSQQSHLLDIPFLHNALVCMRSKEIGLRESTL